MQKALALSARGMKSRQHLELQSEHRPADDLRNLGMATLLPRCDKCDKEHQKYEVGCVAISVYLQHAHTHTRTHTLQEFSLGVTRNPESPKTLGFSSLATKEFEKLLQCGRCKSAFYCSRECQNNAWKTHKQLV